MKKYLLVLICFWSGLQLSFSQTAVIKGKVTDSENNSSLPGVNVVYGNGKGTVTDLDGQFSFSLDAGTYELVFSFIGYDTQTKSITLESGKEVTLEIQLARNTKTLDLVVVSAGRYEQKLEDVTVSMEILKPQLIENKNTTNMETILEQIPGVTVTDGQASIRGGSGFTYGAGSRVLMLVDELPMLAGDAGDVKWNFLPVENIEQVEVIKGASSALYGSSALNGVINVRTAFPKEKPQTKFSVFYSQYNTPVRPDTLGNRRDSLGNLYTPLKWWSKPPTTTGFSAFHSQRFGQLDVVVAGNYFNDEGYREGETEERGRVNFNLRYRFKKIKGLQVGLNGNMQAANGGVFFIWQNADSGAYIPSHTDTSSTLGTYTNSRINLDPYIVYYTKKGARHSFRNRYLNTTNNNSNNASSTADFIYSEYQFHSQATHWLAITTGAVFSFSNVKSDLYGDHQGNNLAAFAQGDIKYGKLNVSLGLRGEYYRVDTFKTQTDYAIFTKNDTITLLKNSKVRPVARIGLNYQLAKATFLRTSFGQGYRFPSIGEKYVNTSISVLKVFPNADLQPESGWSAELGIKQGFKFGKLKGFADAAVFTTEYRNMIEFTFGQYYPDSVEVPNIFDVINYSGFRSINIGHARVSGIDVSLLTQADFGPFKTTFFGGYTYINPVNLNADSTYRATATDSTNLLKYRYQHMGKGDLQLDYKNFSVGLSLRCNSFMEIIDRSFEDPLLFNIEQTKILPGLKEYRQHYNQWTWVYDLRVSYTFNEQLKLSLLSNNLLNREYMTRPGDIQAPRTMMIQLLYNVKYK